MQKDNLMIKTIQELGLPEQSCIGILMDTDVRVPNIILSIIADGHVAVILNQNIPEARLLEQLQMLNITHLIVDNIDNMSAAFAGYQLLDGEKFRLTQSFGQPSHAGGEGPQLGLGVFLRLRREMADGQREANTGNADNDVISALPATIIFTSGSTGNPKAVVHSYDNFKYSALGSNTAIPFVAGDRWLVTLPFYHVSGLSLIWRSLYGGGELIFPTKQKSIFWNIVHHAITHISLVPSQLYELLNDSTTHTVLRAMKAILVGGSALPETLWQKAKDLGLPVYTTYGLSEMASSVTVSTPLNSKSSYHAGQLLPHRELKIGPHREIFVKGETLFLGYADKQNEFSTSLRGGRQKRTTLQSAFHDVGLPRFARNDSFLGSVLDKDGWFNTADIGVLDDNNNLHIIGRQDNMFISGGENIYPEEIEAALLQISGIEAAVVVPVKDDKFGYRPVAFIKTNIVTLPTSLPTLLAKQLPKYKIPSAFYPWPSDTPGDNPPTGLKVNRPFFKKKVQ